MAAWMGSAIDGLLAAAAVAFVLYLSGTPSGRVSRGRLERFARRQLLPVTVGNAPIVLRYLATTRRWRGGGIGVSVVLATSWLAGAGRGGGLSLTAAFAGWFLGAIVAEWRVSLPAAGGARLASLRPRRTRDYIGPFARGFAIAVWAAFVGADLAALGYAVLLRRSVLVPVAGWTLVAWAATAALVLVVRRVLDRPQPPVGPDVQDADDALRSRSLHVLAGAAVAIAGFVGSALVGTLGDSVDWLDRGGSPTFAVLRIAGAILLPILGVQIATTPFRATRAVPRPVAARA